MTLLADIEFIQCRVDLWAYADKRVLVTGATGFIGTWLTMGLNGKCILTLADRKNLGECLRGKYDMIFHLAPSPIEPVIECACRNTAKLLYTSSGAVYGARYIRPKEDEILTPKTDYGVAKVRDEILIKNSGLKHVIARCFSFCGPHMRDHFAVTTFVNALKKDKPMVVYNRGTAIRSYLYAADMAVWLLMLMLKGNGVYNVGSERETTIRELAEAVAERTIPRGKIDYSDKPFIEPAPYYVPDCGKAHKLDLYQWHNLEYGIRRMV